MKKTEEVDEIKEEETEIEETETGKTETDETESDETESEEEEMESEEEAEPEKSKEKDKAVFVHKPIRLFAVITGILIFAAAFLGVFVMSREGIVGLIRLILLPIALGALGYIVLYVLFNLLAGHLKKGHRVLYILKEIIQYVVIILIGYSILNPVKDLVLGAKELEVNIVSRDLATHDAGIRLSSGGNEWKDSKYHMTIIIYGKSGAADTIYEFPIDVDTYAYFQDNQDVLFLDVKYYENTNTMKSFNDVTDEVLEGIISDYFDEPEGED